MIGSSKLVLAVFLAVQLPLVSNAATWPEERAVEGAVRMPAGSALAQSPFSEWVVFSSPSMDRPIMAYGRPTALDMGDPANSARQMVQAATASGGQFEHVRTRSAGRVTYIHFRELRMGLPVLGGRLDAAVNARGQLMRWSLRDYSLWPLSQSHILGAEAAASWLRGTERAGWVTEKSFAAWFPDHDFRQIRPVFWLRLAGAGPHERWEGVVDAANGEVILEWSGIHFDVLSGTIVGEYWPEYNHDSTHVGIHPRQTLTINGNDVTTDGSAHFSAEAGTAAACTTMLRGPYVEVSNEDAPPGRMFQSVNIPFTPMTWTWTPVSAVRPELNLYYHTMLIHQWYKVVDPEFSALDYPLPAVANVGSGYDNAFWNGYGTYYGSGQQYDNFAMYSDVIYHEYTHGVTDGIYPDGMLPYTGQSGAMNEAWSDYIACSINGDPLMGEWLDGSPYSFFRDLESNMVYPYNWVGQVHADSPFISAPLWTVRQAVGIGYTDSLCHFARYALTETFFDYFVAVLEADDDDGDLTNGTPNDNAIYGAFGDHGIGPGNRPNFVVENVLVRADNQGQSIGDGDRFLEAGETGELTFRLRNAAALYPPPATDVQIVVTTEDADVTVSNGVQTVTIMPAGAWHDLSPIILQCSPAAADHWVVINVDVTCNGGQFAFQDTIDITLGTPRLVIIEDDPTSDVERFVRTVVRAQDRIFQLVTLAPGESLPVVYYSDYGMLLWLSGNATGNVLTAQDRAQIVAYLGSGSKVVLSGQDIVDNLAGSDFAQNVLQVEILDDVPGSHAVTASTSPFEPNEWFLLTGSGGAANQTDAQKFNVLGSSQETAHWGRLETGATAAVEFAGGRGMLLGFGIEAISGMAGSASRAEFLDRLFAWAGDLLGDIREKPAAVPPTTYSVGPAYPNPFNATTNIRYAVPVNARAEALVFDVLGRLVHTVALPSSSGEFSWAPRESSGIYFVQIRWDGGRTAPIKLLQLR